MGVKPSRAFQCGLCDADKVYGGKLDGVTLLWEDMFEVETVTNEKVAEERMVSAK
jgi:hypothetical protein